MTDLTPEMIEAASPSPSRMWRIAQFAVEHGWDIKVYLTGDDAFTLVVTDDVHKISIKFVLNAYQGEAKWTTSDVNRSAHCDQRCRVQIKDIEAFLADPPAGHSRYVSQGVALVGAVTL